MCEHNGSLEEPTTVCVEMRKIVILLKKFFIVLSPVKRGIIHDIFTKRKSIYIICLGFLLGS